MDEEKTTSGADGAESTDAPAEEGADKAPAEESTDAPAEGTDEAKSE